MSQTSPRPQTSGARRRLGGERRTAPSGPARGPIATPCAAPAAGRGGRPAPAAPPLAGPPPGARLEPCDCHLGSVGVALVANGGVLPAVTPCDQRRPPASRATDGLALGRDSLEAGLAALGDPSVPLVALPVYWYLPICGSGLPQQEHTGAARNALGSASAGCPAVPKGQRAAYPPCSPSSPLPEGWATGLTP